MGIDIGANVGSHTMVMLNLGLSVIAVEPQFDLCASLKHSIKYSNLTERSAVICGGLATSKKVIEINVCVGGWR